MKASLTILVPVYNEEECIQATCVALERFLEEVDLPTQLLFINDGSTDRSAELIDEICREDPRFNYITLARNSGLSTALKAGIDHCTSDYVGYIDADLQTTPEDFLTLIQYIEDYDLVTGYRFNRKDTIIKKCSSLVANAFRRWMLEDDIIDNCCPLKIMRTDIARQMPFFKGMHRFIPDMVIMLGGTIKQVPVHHYSRYAGKAKYNLANRLLGPFIDTLVFRWMQRNTIHYDIRKQLRRQAAPWQERTVG